MIGLLLTLAAASSAPYSCSQSMTDELIQCAYSKFEKADAALNKQWKSMKHWPEITKAQRAWLAYRDAECDAENPATPEGREYPVHKYLCWARMTDERVQKLRELVSQ
jgi:uncharacterized protein YecT (DUF1311 family)